VLIDCFASLRARDKSYASLASSTALSAMELGMTRLSNGGQAYPPSNFSKGVTTSRFEPKPTTTFQGSP